MKEGFKQKGQRNRLIETLKQKGITDTSVLDAMLKIPRHFFLDSAMADHAYEDRALPIAEGQTISQPYTVAYQTALLQVHAGIKVLEVGTGSGYQAAVLCELGVELYSTERIERLVKFAANKLGKLGYSANLYHTDGSIGLPKFAPFDRIIVTAASPTLGEALIAQLAPNGRMVIPVGHEVQTMILVEKDDQGNVHTQKLDDFKFVPLIGKEGYQK